jgi:hypothetical protein
MASINGSNSSAVQCLIDWYEARTAALGVHPLSRQPWYFGSFTDGTRIPDGARLVYRERLDLQAAFPDPFSSAGNSYQSWYFTQGRHEFPLLFDAETEQEGRKRLVENITPGFQAGRIDSIKPSRVTAKIMEISQNPALFLPTTRKGISIFRAEGFSGLLRRFQ